MKAKKKVLLKRSWKDWLSLNPIPMELQKKTYSDLPSWDEFVQEMEEDEARKKREEQSEFEFSDHRVTVNSPLFKNLLMTIFSVVILYISMRYPALNRELIFGIIFLVFGIAFLYCLREAVFFHLESKKLIKDTAYIEERNKDKKKRLQQKKEGQEEEKKGVIQKILKTKKSKRKFQSELLRIHYSNVLRTFEQGNRKSWVEQSHSLSEIQTMISQGGMKVVWTVMEMLPQLGLVGTLAGLINILQSFEGPSNSLASGAIQGFALALGTTIVANILVLILRPLYMLNERTMVQLLTTLESVMAIFILPTQQQVLDSKNPWEQNRNVKRSIDQLSDTIHRLYKAQSGQVLDSPNLERYSHDISRICRSLENFIVNSDKDREQEKAVLEELRKAIRKLPISSPPEHHAPSIEGIKVPRPEKSGIR